MSHGVHYHGMDPATESARQLAIGMQVEAEVNTIRAAHQNIAALQTRLMFLNPKANEYDDTHATIVKEIEFWNGLIERTLQAYSNKSE